MPGVRLAALMRRLRRDTAPDLGERSDADLLALFATSRNEAAFEQLVWRHGTMVLAVCRRVLTNSEDAEDAFQAAFLVLARKAASIRRSSSVPAWLHRVAMRIAHRAAGKRRTTVFLDTDPPARPVPDSVEQGELRCLLDAEIDRLSEPYRRAFVLCYLKGLSNAEAANLLKCPVGTIESRLTTARRRLRDRLSRRVEFPAGILALLAGGHELAAGMVTTVTRAAAAATDHGLAAAIGIVHEPAVRLAEGVLAMTKTSRALVATVLGASLLVLAASIGWANRPAVPPIDSSADSLPPAVDQPQAIARQTKPTDNSSPNASEWPLAKQIQCNNGNMIGTAPDGKTIILLDNRSVWRVPVNGNVEASCVFSENHIASAALSPDKKFLATAEGVNGVKLRDAATGEIVEALWPSGDLPAEQVAFTPDGAKLVVLCMRTDTKKGDNLTSTQLTRVSVWDPATRKELGSFGAQKYQQPSYSLAGYGRYLLYSEKVYDKEGGQASRQFEIIDAISGKVIRSVEFAGAAIEPARPDPLSPDGKTLVLVDAALNYLRFIDTATGKARFPVEGFRRPIKAVAFSPDGKLIAAATGLAGGDRPEKIAAPSEVVIWDAATGRELARLADKASIRDYSAIAFSPDDSFIAAQASGESMITIWGHPPAPAAAPAEPLRRRVEAGEAGRLQVHPPAPAAAPAEPLAPKPEPAKPAVKGSEVAATPARFQSLIRDLSGEGVTDARRVESLFLAALGRFPTDVEARTLAAQLAGRNDKAAALRDLLGTLVETAEFRSHAEELGRLAK